MLKLLSRTIAVLAVPLFVDSCRWGFEVNEEPTASSMGGLGGEAPTSGGQGPGGSVAQGGAPSSGGALLGGFGGALGGAPASGGKLATGPFSTPTLITEIVQAGAADDDPSFTEDQLELYFSTSRGVAPEEIWLSTRAQVSDPWGVPTALGPQINDTAYNGMPGVTSDGLTLYFVRGVMGDASTWDLYVARRGDRAEAWGAPERIEASRPVNFDASPSGSADGLFLVWGAAGQIASSFRATALDAWGPLVVIEELDSAANEGEPWISDDRRHLFFRRFEVDNEDLFMSTRDDSSMPFSEPVALDSLNTASDETDPWMSQDLSYVVFGSNRDGPTRIYEATR